MSSLCLHKNPPVVYLRRPGVFDKSQNMRLVYGALPHSFKIFAFIYLAPIGGGMQILLLNEIVPDARCSAVAFHKRMGDIHLHMLFDNTFYTVLRHFSQWAQGFHLAPIHWHMLFFIRIYTIVLFDIGFILFFALDNDYYHDNCNNKQHRRKNCATNNGGIHTFTR